MQRKASIVVVLGTGGTIAGLAATPHEQVDYRAAQIGVADLVGSAKVAGGVVVETEQVAQRDSKDMDFATWRTLALRVAHHLAREEVMGVVITHGTDTLEETAYFLARVVAAPKAVVLTAAMRPASSFEADGPRNLADAITVASLPDWRGVCVVIAGQVHATRDVRKVHPHRLDAFSSGDAGVLASVDGSGVRVLRQPEPAGEPFGIGLLPEEASRWPWVEIVTSAAGADGRVVDLLTDAGVDGIVVAGTGNGTVHERLAAALVAARARGVQVLRSTRCVDGTVVATSDDTFAAAGDLTPVKARVELVLELLEARRRAIGGR